MLAVLVQDHDRHAWKMRKHTLFWFLVGTLLVSLIVGILFALFDRGDPISKKPQNGRPVTSPMDH